MVTANISPLKQPFFFTEFSSFFNIYDWKDIRWYSGHAIGAQSTVCLIWRSEEKPRQCQKCRPNFFSNSVVRRHDRSNEVDVAWRDLNHLEYPPSLKGHVLLLFRHVFVPPRWGLSLKKIRYNLSRSNDKNQKMEYTCNLSGFLSSCLLLRPDRNHNETFRQRARRRLVRGKSNKKTFARIATERDMYRSWLMTDFCGSLANLTKNIYTQNLSYENLKQP